MLHEYCSAQAAFTIVKHSFESHVACTLNEWTLFLLTNSSGCNTKSRLHNLFMSAINRTYSKGKWILGIPHRKSIFFLLSCTWKFYPISRNAHSHISWQAENWWIPKSSPTPIWNPGSPTYLRKESRRSFEGNAPPLFSQFSTSRLSTIQFTCVS